MVGRGGAGNILAVQQQQERVAEDLEANRGSQAITTEGSREPEPIREEQQYAYTGRGGAGNYYVPKELEKTGHFHDAHTSHILGDATPAPDGSAPGEGRKAPIQPTRWQGRGGAGNYAVGVAESEEKSARQKEEDDEKKEALVKAEVEKDVEEMLAMPPKARLGSEKLL